MSCEKLQADLDGMKTLLEDAFEEIKDERNRVKKIMEENESLKKFFERLAEVCDDHFNGTHVRGQIAFCLEGGENKDVVRFLSRHGLERLAYGFTSQEWLELKKLLSERTVMVEILEEGCSCQCYEDETPQELFDAILHNIWDGTIDAETVLEKLNEVRD